MPEEQSQRLTRRYLLDHVPPDDEDPPPDGRRYLKPPSTSGGDESDGDVFARHFSSLIFTAAAEKIGDQSLEQMTIDVPVSIRPIAKPEGGCIGVNLGVVEWHGDYKGDKPGRG